MLQLGGMLNKPMQFKCIIHRSGGKAPSRWEILQFLEKKTFYRRLDHILNVF